jgi:hypothetical protein
MQVHLRQQLHPSLRTQTHFITETRKDLKPCARRIGWYVMSNQVVLISTAEKSLRLTHSVLPSPWKDLSVVLCYRRYFDDDVIAANRLPTSMFTMQCGLRPFSSTARLVTLSIPGYGSSSCRRLPTSMSAQKCGPKADRHLILTRHIPDVTITSKQ